MGDPNRILLPLDGKADPHIEALGWQWAYGCFETFIWNQGTTVALEKHLDRFFVGCRSLDMECPIQQEDPGAIIKRALAPFINKTLRVRLEGVLDDPGLMDGAPPPFRMRVGLRMLEVAPPERKEDFAIRLLDRESTLRLRSMPLYKPLDYSERLRIRNRNLQQGFPEAVVIAEDLRIVSGLTSNLFLRTSEGTWITPTVDSGCLPGITRGLLLEGETPEKMIEKEVHFHDLTEATSVVLTNSGMGVQPVHRLHFWEGSSRDFVMEPSKAISEWYEGLGSED